jgi:hypothetical protein
VRRRGTQFDIIEGQCVQGELVEGGIFMDAILADGKVMTYSTELPTE